MLCRLDRISTIVRTHFIERERERLRRGGDGFFRRVVRRVGGRGRGRRGKECDDKSDFYAEEEDDDFDDDGQDDVDAAKPGDVFGGETVRRFLFQKKSNDHHFGRNDFDDDDDETTRKRRDAHTIRRDAKMVVKKRIESKTEEEEDGTTTTFGEEVTKATKAKRPKEKRQVEGGVKERERKKRQAGQNGRDTTEWKTEAEMVLRQQYD